MWTDQSTKLSQAIKMSEKTVNIHPAKTQVSKFRDLSPRPESP